MYLAQILLSPSNLRSSSWTPVNISIRKAKTPKSVQILSLLSYMLFCSTVHLRIFPSRRRHVIVLPRFHGRTINLPVCCWHAGGAEGPKGNACRHNKNIYGKLVTDGDLVTTEPKVPQLQCNPLPHSSHRLNSHIAATVRARPEHVNSARYFLYSNKYRPVTNYFNNNDAGYMS